MRIKTILISVLIIPLISWTAALIIKELPPAEHLEAKIYDYKLKLGENKKVSDIVRTIVVDDQSIQLGSKWPWPWINHASVASFLSRTNVRVVGIDIRFENYEDNIQGMEALRYYYSMLGNVVLPYYFKTHKDGVSYSDRQEGETDGDLKRYAIPVDRKFFNSIPEAKNYILPLKELRHSAWIGFTNMDEDSDGVVRKAPLLYKHGEDYYPSYILMILCRYYGKTASDIIVEKGFVRIKGTDISIPVNQRGEMMINFRSLRFKGDPALQILKADRDISQGMESVVPLSDYEEKIVIYGVGMTGGYDIGLIPLSSNKSPLLLAHANALNTILQKDYVHQVPHQALLALIFTALIGAVSLLQRQWPIWIASVFLIIGLQALSVAMFLSGNYYINSILPLFSMTLCLFSSTGYKLALEIKAKQQIKSILGKYISKSVMDMLLKDPSMLKLSGEKKTMTVLFSDIKGFTAYSENKTPDEVVAALNAYLDRMTRIILSLNGTVDKYIGDAIMAFWNAPIAQPEHARLAVSAALKMVEELEAMRISSEGCTFDMGVGINTGEMMVGNMGSQFIYDYTVIGDNVNLASRVEGLTRKYPYRVIITEATYEEIKDYFEIEYLDEVSVKGKDKSIKIYGVKESKNLKLL